MRVLVEAKQFLASSKTNDHFLAKRSVTLRVEPRRLIGFKGIYKTFHDLLADDGWTH